MRSRHKWTMRFFSISSAFTHSSTPYFFTYLSSTWISGWNRGAHSKIPSKVRALPRFRESRPRHLGSRGQRQRRAFSTFVTFYPEDRPTTYSRSCTSKIHYLYLCPPLSTTAVTVGLEWGWNTTVSPHHHATTCSPFTIFIVPSLSPSRNGGNENCLQSRNSRWCPLLQLQPSQHQQCCYKFYFGGEADCVFET